MQPYLDIVLQVVAGALTTAEQISCVEGVVHVPANATGCCRQVADTKLLPLQQSSMEVAQRKDDGPVFRLQKECCNYVICCYVSDRSGVASKLQSISKEQS